KALILGLPLLALTVALGGWLMTGAMFKPVRSMIEQADAISTHEAGERLAISGGGEELRALAARLNAMLDRMDEAAVRERAFLDDASHELRTPIAIVRGELELARERVSGDDEQRATLDSVLDEVERLERLAQTCWSWPVPGAGASPPGRRRWTSKRSSTGPPGPSPAGPTTATWRCAAWATAW